ncbi:MAG: acyltransferase [Prevotellaceae bacterium]|nr:acyltransferase [Candidatus Colivivens equi]
MNNQPTTINHQPSSSRLEWLDAMRGFTMILVVMYHVGLQGFAEDFKQSSSMPFLVLFRMPLFFFISGFLSYKANADWSFSGFCSMMFKKIRIQIIPTIVFFFAFAAIITPSHFTDTIVSNFHSPTKGGFWFTLVLLYMFIVYYIFEYFEQKIKKHTCIPIILLWVVAILLYESCYLPKTFYWAYGAKKALQTGWLYDSSIFQFLLFFHFFVFGNIIHRYWYKVERIYDSHGFILAILAIAFFSTGDYLKFHWLTGSWANLSQTLARYSLLTLIFLFFRYYQDCISHQHWIGRKLQYIGTRTLDIYLIHFFFIPNLPEIGHYFQTHSGNLVMEITTAFIVAIIVIAFSLVMSSTLRISPFLKKYLFGRG